MDSLSKCSRCIWIWLLLFSYWNLYSSSLNSKVMSCFGRMPFVQFLGKKCNFLLSFLLCSCNHKADAFIALSKSFLSIALKSFLCSLGIKSDVVFPFKKELFSKHCTRKSLFVFIPARWVDLNSLARSFADCSLVSPIAITLASIGS